MRGFGERARAIARAKNKRLAAPVLKMEWGEAGAATHCLSRRRSTRGVLPYGDAQTYCNRSRVTNASYVRFVPETYVVENWMGCPATARITALFSPKPPIRPVFGTKLGLRLGVIMVANPAVDAPSPAGAGGSGGGHYVYVHAEQTGNQGCVQRCSADSPGLTRKSTARSAP